MWVVAFSLGLVGSLHCVGMCGPLAIVFCTREGSSKIQTVQSALAYNIGRTVTYSILGLLFGLLGSFLFVTDLQKTASIILGILLIVAFMFNINIDNSINGNSIIKKYHAAVRNFISRMMAKSKEYHPFQLGMANGLLPCGLVYLALAGALATGHILSGITFMALFGLGTIPMLFALVVSIDLFPMKVRRLFKPILPYVSLAFGIFLIYRGIAIDMPSELNFWEALKNPLLCH